MDWVSEAKNVFKQPKPQSFVPPHPCPEGKEHDETLKSVDIDTIGLEHLKEGWDPISFCTVDGFKYYMPAFIRLTLETMKTEDFYLDRFLFHLSYDGPNNDRVIACTTAQKKFTHDFLESLIEDYPEVIDEEKWVTDDLFKAIEIWNPEG